MPYRPSWWQIPAQGPGRLDSQMPEEGETRRVIRVILALKSLSLTHVPIEKFSQEQGALKASPPLQHMKIRGPHYGDFTFTRKISWILCLHNRKQSEKRSMWGSHQNQTSCLTSRRSVQWTEDSELKSKSGFLTDNHKNTSFLLASSPQQQYWPLEFTWGSYWAHPHSYCVLADTEMNRDEENAPEGAVQFSPQCTV